MMCQRNLQKTMNKPLPIAIYIPDEDAKKFLLFQEYYDVFTMMVEHGAFGVRNGSVTMHFDKKGSLKAINRADILYSARFDE